MNNRILLISSAIALLGAGCLQGGGDVVGTVPPPAPPSESGVVKEVTLVAGKTTIELKPGLSTEAWAYNGTVPGPEIRLALGDRVRLTLKNELDEPTTIHWHGVRVPAGMDGVPMISQEPVPPGGTFVYEFVPPDAGTYFYHSHVRVDEQVDRGLYGAFIVEPPEPFGPDAVFALDDWLLDARGNRLPTSRSRPETDIDNALDAVSELRASAGLSDSHMMGGGTMMGGMEHGGMAMMDHAMPAELNGRFGNVMTVNGKAVSAVPTTEIPRGGRLYARFLNASNAMTHELKASDGRALTVVAVDGVTLKEPVAVSRLVLPSAKRFDVLLEDVDGKSWTLEGGTGDRAIRIAFEVGEPAPETGLPTAALTDLPDLSRRAPDAVFNVATDSMMSATTWLVNGRAFDMEKENPVMATFPRGTWVKLRFVNQSPMAHTMHVHGHFMRVISRDGRSIEESASEDTIVVRPMETIDVAMLADNPGDWVVHCHNLDHEEHGLMAKFRVE